MTACSPLIDSLMCYFHIMSRLTVYQRKRKKKKKQETVRLWPCFSNSISEKINSGVSDVVPESKGQTPPSSAACHRLTTFYGTGNLNGGRETVRDYHSRKCAFPVARLFVSCEFKAAQNSKFDFFSSAAHLSVAELRHTPPHFCDHSHYYHHIKVEDLAAQEPNISLRNSKEIKASDICMVAGYTTSNKC